MTKRTRLFLVISGGILVVGLGTGLVASYMGGFQNFSLIGSSQPAELAYVPADAQVVAFANIREIMDSELRQKLRELQPRNGEGLARFESETGVSVERDIDYVFTAFGADSKQGPPLVLARGRFDAVRIEGLARSKGGQVEDYKGIRVITHTEPGMGVALGFLEPGLVGIGSTDALHHAIDAKKGSGGSVTSNRDVMRLVKQTNDSNAWAVARFDKLAAEGRVPAEVARRLPAIQWLTVTGHVNGGLKAGLSAETGDDAAAKNLREVVQGVLALAKLQSGQRAEITSVVDSIQMSGEGKTVSLSFALPSQAIDLLAGMHGRGGAPRRPSPPAPVPAP